MLTFENYPSTDTPVNATNLNANFEELQELIENNTYYQPGDTYTIGGQVNVGGFVTSSRTSLRFSIFLPKSLEKINSVTLNSMNVSIRHAAGGYILNEATSSDGAVNFNAYIRTPNIIDFYLGGDYTSTSAANNTPIGVAINSLSLTFN